MVKEELSSEEKFFEKAVITERFVKKYKTTMIASAVVVVAIIIANITYDINTQSKKDASNKALAALMVSASDAEALENLKSNSPDLYDVWILSEAIVAKDNATLKELSKSKAMIVGDLASYELATDAKSLDAYASKQDAIYRDLALLRSAVYLMNSNKIDEAHDKLLKISAQSSLIKVAQALLHYGVK
jgi:hypothetical protein